MIYLHESFANHNAATVQVAAEAYSKFMPPEISLLKTTDK